MSTMLDTAEQGGQILGSGGLHTDGGLRGAAPGQELMGVGSLPLRIGGSLQKKGLAEGSARCGLSGLSAGHPRGNVRRSIRQALLVQTSCENYGKANIIAQQPLTEAQVMMAICLPSRW